MNNIPQYVYMKLKYKNVSVGAWTILNKKSIIQKLLPATLMVRPYAYFQFPTNCVQTYVGVSVCFYRDRGHDGSWTNTKTIDLLQFYHFHEGAPLQFIEHSWAK